MRSLYFIWTIASSIVALGCGSAASDSFGQLVDSETVNNGTRINGTKINGTRINGTRINGQSIGNITLSNGQVSIPQGNGNQLAGAQLTGALLVATQDDGSTVDLRIDSVTLDQTTSLWEYGISVQGTDGSFSPLCGLSGTTPVLAIPIAGRFDSTSGGYINDDSQFTFACLNAALGKCVLWGYKPWQTQQECKTSRDCKQQPLLDWHIACTRLVRADYCGDGVSHTRDGTSINVWDVFNIESQDSTGWEMEAEWTVNGAQCIRHTRWVQADPTLGTTDLQYVQSHCPSRLASNAGRNNSCDTDKSSFLTKNGYKTDLDQRRLLRNESAYNH